MPLGTIGGRWYQFSRMVIRQTFHASSCNGREREIQAYHYVSDLINPYQWLSHECVQYKLQEPSTIREGDLVAFKTKESPFSQINTSFRFGRVHSLLKRPNSLDGTSRSAYVSYFNMPGDLKEDGQEYEQTGKEVITLRRIDSLIALDTDEHVLWPNDKERRWLTILHIYLY